MSQALAGGALQRSRARGGAGRGAGQWLRLLPVRPLAHGQRRRGRAETQFAARQGESSALTAFARKVTLTRAQVNDQDVADARSAGLTDAQIVEVLAQVAFNTLTNYLEPRGSHRHRLPRREGSDPARSGATPVAPDRSGDAARDTPVFPCRRSHHPTSGPRAWPTRRNASVQDRAGREAATPSHRGARTLRAPRAFDRRQRQVRIAVA